MTFEELIKVLEAMGSKDFPNRIASKVAGKLEASLTATLSAGESPDGQAWVARKKGGRAYANAASKLDVKAIGNLVKVTLVGPEVFGHFGAGGTAVRKMLPDGGGGTPEMVVEAMKAGAQEVIDEVTRG